MKKILFMWIGISLFITIDVSAQTGNLERLPQAQRDSLLLKVAQDAALKYAPEWYRNELPPKIEYFGYSKNSKYLHRKMYLVTFFADKSKDPGAWHYAVKVYVWEDTGKATQIDLPSGLSINGMDERPETRSGEKIATPPFIPKPPHWNHL